MDKIYSTLHLFIFAFILFGMTACSESLENRAAREAKEFTQKYCPTPEINNERTDSTTFDKDTRTFTYWRTLTGKADNKAVIDANKNKLNGVLLEAVKNNPSMKIYKENGFNFHFVYRSAKDKSILIETTFGEKEYKD